MTSSTLQGTTLVPQYSTGESEACNCYFFSPHTPPSAGRVERRTTNRMGAVSEIVARMYSAWFKGGLADISVGCR